MSSLFPSADNPRPRQVTFGATLAVTGGLVLLFALVDLMIRLESIEVTQALTDGLRSLRLSGDVSVEQARDVLRYSIMIFAVLSAAAVVFGIFTLKRDRTARVGLTAVIGTIGVVALFGGPATWLITVYIAVSVALLWSRSAREWFAGTGASASSGRPAGPRDTQRDQSVPPPTPPPGPPPAGWRPPAPWMAPPPAARPQRDDDPAAPDAEDSQRPPRAAAPGPPAPPPQAGQPGLPGPPPGWSPPPYGPSPRWQPPPGWIPPPVGPPPGWPHLPPPPPGWRPAGGWQPPPLQPPPDGSGAADAEQTSSSDDDAPTGEGR